MCNFKKLVLELTLSKIIISINSPFELPRTFDELFIKVNRGVIENINQANKQLEQYKNPLEPYFKDFYGLFLKANNQKQGIKSYNMVVSLLVNYYSSQ